ncbi:uncharacterized protein BO95DRAFT_446527 [Aspergillus brunneoviolaceus CBS 621.78]|uniref:Uncharacterized protein n=1 Tax=Aspergillus brunneoviolaceus CBS 621.78 TaxID=1450534 RepID=A0ACD1FY83_9EURO|nr:hypothetical protein BO95DRAFT_446527 [Aspergillus brunneoviolaceus CBS 621.78]RAH41917.1 hypothetical protein BO95DRAFT_446527 [Aspergillus brunneoviolaceus CBS 621.78]
MFAQFMTAAKGLFNRSTDSNGKSTLPKNFASDSVTSAAVITPKKMVTATRRRKLTAEQSAEPEVGTSSIDKRTINGKRKSEPNTTSSSKTQDNSKRRKRGSSSLEDVQESEDDEMATTTTATTTTSNKKAKMVEDSDSEVQEETPLAVAAPPAAKKKHFRFDSEEPEVPEMEEEVAETPQGMDADEEEEEDSSDDEAPEAVDNSAQLSKIRMEAKRQERAKQIEEQLKRDKRKQLDDLRKLQAKSANKKREAEDQLSESTETLQGTTTESARRSALPALLPDDILNAAPDVRPPTPPAEEMEIVRPKPTKLRFLDKKEKAPKDLQMGDVTIRVLDGDVSRKKSKTALPPKSSKSSQNARQAWLSAARSTAKVNGMRRTAGGSSGFVRK